MTTRPLSTRTRLIHTAAELFRRSGYHGVGLSELLSTAQAPKGSLYHHFPAGKSDLALAAASWASDGMLHLIAVSFDSAPSFREGLTTLCHKIAKMFEKAGLWGGCPISATLFAGPDTPEFAAHASKLYDSWIAAVAKHARRFGYTDPETLAETLFILLQGSWQLAQAKRDASVLRSLPARLPLFETH